MDDDNLVRMTMTMMTKMPMMMMITVETTMPMTFNVVGGKSISRPSPIQAEGEK
jgi:hypothetical protein